MARQDGARRQPAWLLEAIRTLGSPELPVHALPAAALSWFLADSPSPRRPAGNW